MREEYIIKNLGDENEMNSKLKEKSWSVSLEKEISEMWENESLYDFSKDGRKDRIDDLSNGITYLSNYNDTTSQLHI